MAAAAAAVDSWLEHRQQVKGVHLVEFLLLQQ